ncbi:sugar-binding protein [Flavobacterium hibernum]|uniref:Endoxylanase n=1 Tax=Flavobacterium hibernum TaxID=37752 RepID=A0A0D0F0K8_9FLAO|nr:sugar-binding protein [Flavobacterium hibernum]KIO51462.1 endoxylanase [Flavobacterium hibernum]OXA84906.1 endoxylanase [Flavobacterium hibernum]PTT01261.1 endoxylanase [Flavobacterium sp. HMWF030]STO19315.1 Domain of uncharacterised function (DUF1083) [Flavobacterium hibernum]
MKEYQVKLVSENHINFNESLNGSFFEKANCLTDFCSAWNEDPILKIEFRALWNLENFFFNFRVFDTDVYLDQKDDSFDSIGNSDRVELFFRKNESLNPYFCLEMDASGRLMDFKAHPNKDFDFDWKWPKKDLDIKTSKDEISFTVEGRISIQSLRELNLIEDNIIEAGVYRAKFSKNEKQEYEPTWISWVNPNTETPNFHIASSFGKFRLL